MQAWLCENPVGVEALSWKELPTPEPGPGQIRVAIRAASLNFPDLLIVQGKYQVKPPTPFVPRPMAAWFTRVRACAATAISSSSSTTRLT